MQKTEAQAAQLEAQRASSACEIDSARQQAGQLTKQLSEQTQKLQLLQVGKAHATAPLPVLSTQQKVVDTN